MKDNPSLEDKAPTRKEEPHSKEARLPELRDTISEAGSIYLLEMSVPSQSERPSASRSLKWEDLPNYQESRAEGKAHGTNVKGLQGFKWRFIPGSMRSSYYRPMRTRGRTPTGTGRRSSRRRF